MPLEPTDCRGRVRQLFQPLPEVFPVVHDRLELPVQNPEHDGVLVAERAPAGGALALRAELGDPIALLLDLVVLIEQLRPLRRRVLRLTNPSGPLLRGRGLRRLEARAGVPCLALRPLQGGGGRGEIPDALLESPDRARQLVPLRLLRAACRLLPLQQLEVGDFALEACHRRELLLQLLQLLARLERIGQLLVEPLELLAPHVDALLRHAALAVERQGTLAPSGPLLPARLLARQQPLRRRARRFGRTRRIPRRGEPRFRTATLRGEGLGVGQRGLEPAQLRRERVADLAHALLREPQPLVAQHLRQERRPLGLAERRHHLELLLAREVGAEELLVRHPQRLRELVRHGLEGIGDEPPVLVQRGRGQAARDAVFVGPKPEFELHFDAGPAFGADPPDRILVPARRLRAVQRPRDRLEDRGLPGPVGADDPCDAGAELELGVGVLPEVHQAQPVQLHQAGSSRSTCST